jgi:hypothetical protein
MTARATVQETARALLEPRRLLPILLVCVPMVAIQRAYSQDPLAVPLAIATCLAFIAIGPLSWRVLFPDHSDNAFAGRLLIYALVGGGVVWILGVAVPHLAGMGHTFLTTRHTLWVTLALFWVGGGVWGETLVWRHRCVRSRPVPENWPERPNRLSSWLCAAIWILTSYSTL